MGDADAAYLEAFLASRKRPEGTLLYYELEGFLFAVACSPDLVMPSEWTPLIFAEKEAGYADGEEAQRTLDCLMAMYNRVSGGVFERAYALPPGCEFRDELLDNFGPDGPIGQWSQGFMAGHHWLDESWDAYVPDELDEELASLLMVLTFFGSRRLGEAFVAEGGGDGTLESLAELVRSNFDMAMQDYVMLARTIQTVMHGAEAEAEAEEPEPAPPSAPKAGRNEPCPCGSGRKFKRCCGLVH